MRSIGCNRRRLVQFGIKAVQIRKGLIMGGSIVTWMRHLTEELVLHPLGAVYDNNREFVMAQTSWKQANLSILEGEATALFEGLQMAIDKGWENVIFESDSLILVDSIYSHVGGESKFCL